MCWAVVCCKWGWSVHSARAGAWGVAGTGNPAAARADLSLPGLLVKPMCAQSSLAESKLLQPFYLIQWSSNQPGPQDWATPSVSQSAHSTGWVPTHAIFIFLWVPSQGPRSQSDSFSPLPTILCVYLSYCLGGTGILLSFPVSFQ